MNSSSNQRFSESFLKYATFTVAMWYIFLCLIQYFLQRPLWNDEAAVFLSVNGFSFKQMFSQNLLMWQVFPRGYLFLIQIVSKPFNFHLLALRFLAMCSMLGGFVVWLKIVKYEIKNSFSYFIFVLSWSASSMLIYYSSELKQYSMDIFVSSIIILFLYNQKDLQAKLDAGLYSVILFLLPALGFLSYPAFLFVFFPVWNVFLSRRADKNASKFILISLSGIIFFTVMAYLFDMRFRNSGAVTTGFGDYFISFTSVGEFFKTFGEGVTNLFSRWFAERPRIFKKIALSFFAFGFLNMFYSFFAHIRKNGLRMDRIYVIGFVVFWELFALGALKKYPFTVPRTSLFFCPIVLFLTVTAMDNLGKIHWLLGYILKTLYIVFCFVLVFLLSRIVIMGQLTSIPYIWFG